MENRGRGPKGGLGMRLAGRLECCSGPYQEIPCVGPGGDLPLNNQHSLTLLPGHWSLVTGHWRAFGPGESLVPQSSPDLEFPGVSSSPGLPQALLAPRSSPALAGSWSVAKNHPPHPFSRRALPDRLRRPRSAGPRRALPSGRSSASRSGPEIQCGDKYATK